MRGRGRESPGLQGMTLTPPGRTCVSAPGFTLVELAVTLFIVTLLLGTILIPLQTQVESRKIEETQQILDRAKEALLGYAASFGYFPRPANDTSNGMEAPRVPPDPPPHPPGRDYPQCSSYHGFLPAALLGFTPVDSQGYGLDAWGATDAHRIRYALSNHTVGGIPEPFHRAGGMVTAGIPSIGATSQLLYICDSGVGVAAGTNCGLAQTLASNVVAVVWSPGQNATTGGMSAHEAENPNPNSGGSADRIFVSRVRSSF